MLHIGVIGDYDPGNPTHAATDAALAHSSARVGVASIARWVGTETVAEEGPACLEGLSCLLISPGSPYRSLDGALAAITWARTSGAPTLGTCGGFQHMVIEVARSLLGYADAGHAELDPQGQRLIIVPVACSLRGQALPVAFEPGSRVALAYGELSAVESYYCSFELNTAYVDELAGAGLRVTGTGPDAEPRVVELDGHPFFMGTLFVPQVASSLDRPHPLVNALLTAALERSGAGAF